MEVLCRKYAFPIERHSRPVTSFNSPYLPELGSPIFGNELNTDQTNILVYLRFAKTILSDYVNYIYTIHLVFIRNKGGAGAHLAKNIRDQVWLSHRPQMHNATIVYLHCELDHSRHMDLYL